jgi:hypothetical protein
MVFLYLPNFTTSCGEDAAEVAAAIVHMASERNYDDLLGKGS